MREKSIIALVTLSLLSLPILIAPMTIGAQEQKVFIYLETDKPYYKYGDCGELSVTVWNNATGPIEIKNITVTFPWFVLEGRETETIEDIETALSANETSEPFLVSFTVPAEGRRWYGSNADVKVYYLLGEKLDHEDQSIGIRIDQMAGQSEVLTPIYTAMIVMIALLVLTLLALILTLWSLRKLILAPHAASAAE